MGMAMGRLRVQVPRTSGNDSADDEFPMAHITIAFP